jgi:hypothetical protein
MTNHKTTLRLRKHRNILRIWRCFGYRFGLALSHRGFVYIAAFAKVTIVSSIVFLTLKRIPNLAPNLMELLHPDE